MNRDAKRLDYQVIGRIIESGSSVLDLGCGSGDLLLFLVREKKARVQGIELNDDAIHQCVEKGLSVFHGDIDSGLSYYPDKSFDYVILNQSLQEVKGVDFVILEALRVGRRVIVGFPNFAHWEARFSLGFLGRAPVSPSLPHAWNKTPNLRFLSVWDFRDYCRNESIKILEARYLGKRRPVYFLPNLFATNALFLLEGRPPGS
ncbi:MAG: methionine biosynthesis protein MetW [Candidatus Omnitrophota bacterium]|jgi:methionine biosynthesis protein MetW